MYYVGGPDIRTAYYCPHCYNLFEARAIDEIPDLFAEETNELAAAVQLDALLKLTKKRPDALARSPRAGRSPSLLAMFPVALIVDRLPFKRYYLTGEELEQCAEAARRELRVEAADAG